MINAYLLKNRNIPNAFIAGEIRRRTSLVSKNKDNVSMDGKTRLDFFIVVVNRTANVY